jgi:hypothetical protein
MDDPTFIFEWKSHIVLACITCENVILLSRTGNDQKVARRTCRNVMQLITTDLDPRKFDDGTANLLLPTVCSSCDGAAASTSLLISRNSMQTWQPYLAASSWPAVVPLPESSIWDASVWPHYHFFVVCLGHTHQKASGLARSTVCPLMAHVSAKWRHGCLLQRSSCHYPSPR